MTRARLYQGIPKASSIALDMLERLLAFSPDKRIGVEEALQHPYLKLTVTLQMSRSRLPFPRISWTSIREREN